MNIERLVARCWPAVLAAVLTAASARAEVAMSPIFSDGMVLQRGEKVPVYGQAANGEKITVEFRGKTAETAADKDGKWRVEIPPGEAGGPFIMTVKGQNAITVKDVYVGDVWVCAGQSNMAMGKIQKPLKDAPEMVRYFTGFGPTRVFKPAEQGIWRTDGFFSTLGANVAEELYRREKVPMGMIFAAVGGSYLAPWLPKPVGELPEALPRDKKITGKPDLYEGCIRPLQPYRIKGVIWWQGGADCRVFIGQHRYPLYFPAMIKGWRADWGQGDFPFIYVGLQSYSRVAPGAELVRDAKRRALALPNTAMAITFDLTNDDIIPCKTPGDTHPVLFPEMLKPITDRLMKAVRAVAYGDDVEWSGPLVDRIVLRNGEATVTFTHVGEGLVVKSREGGAERLYGFAVQENVPADTPMWDKSQWEEVDFKPSIPPRENTGNRTWAPKGMKPVEARLSDDKKSVILTVKGLTPPLRVFYATGAVPLGSLYNSADLPAVPFVSDPVKQEGNDAN
jgi:sialate O-acetylesterase